MRTVEDLKEQIHKKLEKLLEEQTKLVNELRELVEKEGDNGFQ